LRLSFSPDPFAIGYQHQIDWTAEGMAQHLPDQAALVGAQQHRPHVIRQQAVVGAPCVTHNP
jgi:hypothetical protein